MGEPVVPGEILAEKYRVDRVLGIGGMGVVVAAHHIDLDTLVALKFMLPAAFQSPEAMARFQREARIAVKLRSEHAARVSDTGTLSNGSLYIVMEYLEGADLGAQLAQHGPMPVGFAAECLVQACDAVGEAHALGIVHRDLKPANLFLTRRGDGSPLIKVLDFGISKAIAAEETMAMTKTGVIMGSPLYMSPEQLRSLKSLDARADIWALGCVLYELLSGRTPFTADTFADLLLQVMTAPHPPLKQLCPTAPPEVAALIDKCLAKDPAARVQNVADIAEALAPFCSATGVVLAQRIANVARKSGSTSGARVITGQAGAMDLTSPMAPTTAAAWNTSSRAAPVPLHRTPWAGILGGSLALVAVAAAVLFFTARDTTPASSATSIAPLPAVAAPPPTSADEPAASAAPPATATATPDLAGSTPPSIPTVDVAPSAKPSGRTKPVPEAHAMAARTPPAAASSSPAKPRPTTDILGTSN